MNISPLVSAPGAQDVSDPHDVLAQLGAHRIDDGNLLMAVPVYAEGMAWAKACFEHDIGAVVSLGTEAEHEQLHPCMETSVPIVGGERQVLFGEPDYEWTAGPAAKRLMLAHPKTFAGIVQIDMGKAKAARADARHEVSSFTVPIPPDEPISPAILLATCQALHEEVSGRPIAFQSPHGDHRAGVFAAAHGLFQGFVKGEVNERNLAACVARQCHNLSAARGVARGGLAAHKASLLAMGNMMLEAPGDGHMGTPTAMRTPEMISIPLATAPRSTMKGARAQERALRAQQKDRAGKNTGQRSALYFAKKLFGLLRRADRKEAPKLEAQKKIKAQQENRAGKSTGGPPAVHFEKQLFGFLSRAGRKEARELEAQKKNWPEEDLVRVRQTPGRRSASPGQTQARVFPSEESVAGKRDQ